MFGVCKLESLGYNPVMMSTVVSTQYTSVTDRRTDIAQILHIAYSAMHNLRCAVITKTQNLR